MNNAKSAFEELLETENKALKSLNKTMEEAMLALEQERDALKAEAQSWRELKNLFDQTSNDNAHLRHQVAALDAELEAARKQEPCGWQCTIAGENNLVTCSKDNYETVIAAPNEYPGFEVRAVYASPVLAQHGTDMQCTCGHRWIAFEPQENCPRCNPAQQSAEVTPEMLRAAQTQSELGAIACREMSGAYDLITELYEVMHKASLKGGENER